MSYRPILRALAWLGLGLLLLWAVAGCGGKSDDSFDRETLEEPSAASSIENRAPCAGTGESGDPCEPRDVSRFDLSRSNILSSRHGGAADTEEEPPSVENVLEKGLRLAGASPVHLAFRGTGQEDSVRCDLRGVARTPAQREAAIRFWLDLDDDEALPSAPEVERRFMAELDLISVAYPEAARANLRTLARGGVTTDYQFLSCYADYTVHEYLLGAGTASLTVAYDHMADARSYELYSRGHAAGEFGDEPLMTAGEYQSALQEAVWDVESLLNGLVVGRESVVFLAPMGAHGAIAIEAWQVVAQWDLQTDDADTVNAVRYGTFEGDPEHSQTLANLKSRVTTAAAGDEFADDRIANVSGLTQYYRNIGAYGDITPDDGETTTFTPSQPPPVFAPAPATLTATASGEATALGDESADLSWSSVAGASGYHVQRRISGEGQWTTADESVTGTSRTVTGLWCGRTHEFRVGAYGDGTTYNARAGLWSPTATAMTAACSPLPPRFGADSYSFEVSVATSAGDYVGAVSAIDLNDDPVTYSISAGNEAGKFSIDESTGEMTLAARLGSAAGTTYTLTVGAADGVSGTTSVTVTVTVAAADCTGGTVVTDPGSEPALVSDCEALLTLRDALAGTATLDWSEDTAISSWDGVTVGGTPIRVTALDLEGLRLTGGVPPGLGVLTGLEELLLGINRLTGGIPVELGDLSNLRKLYLRYNRLTGSIPRELGDLSNLTVLWLQGNLLTGEMPPELGDLTQLEHLSMFSNLVSGPIPEELGALTELEQLRLQYNELSGNIPWDLVNLSNLSTLELKGNSLEGCVPPSLHRVGINDLASLGLSDCTESGRVPAPSGLSATLADGTFTITWSAVTGAARYEAQHRVEGADDDWASLPVTDGASSTFSPEDGPICGSSYEFRVRSYGDASTYAAGWSVASGVKSVTTDACNRDPEFDPASYDFEVSEDASIGDAVGTVSATDPDEDDMVSYSITADDSDGKFAIGESTGEITVEGDLNYETTDSYTLTVEAGDGNDGSATATVEISVTDVAEDAPPAPQDLSATLADGAFTITWSALTGAGQYEAQYRISGSDEEWAALPATEVTSATYSPDGGPACETTYEFRVRAYGDGTTYAAVWGAESSAEPATTDACNRDPEFDPAAYAFMVSEDASIGHSVGAVSATDPDEGDTVSYWITAGNEDGKFAIDRSAGEITVAGALDYEATASYTLTVEARDGNDGTATATATITVTEATCSGGIAVSDPSGEPGLVRDCETLMSLRDALAGTATLNWGFGAAMTSWDGVTVGGTPRRVTELNLTGHGLTGTIPPGLGGLTGLELLLLDHNTLTGGIPPELGDLSNLRELYLSFNGLTGPIPPELGNLSNLTVLWFHTNGLTGEIPTELGNLSNLLWLSLSVNGLTGPVPTELGGLTELAQLWLHENQLSGEIPSELGMLTDLWLLQLNDNRLSGSIPWELGNLSNLLILKLSGNSLEGCVQPSLRSVRSNDFASLGLPYCIEEGPVPAPQGLSVSLADDSFSITWSALTGAGEYEAEYRISGSGEDWASVETTTATVVTFSPEGGPACGTTYEFRVRAYGDGTTYAAGWSVESGAETVTTSACNRDPVFDPASYSFSVSENVSTGDPVGSVSATDLDEGDTVSYSITTGNEGGKFAIGGSTGEITVAGALDYETAPSYTLTVEAGDGNDGSATATVEISVTDVAEDAPPAPQDLSATLADGAFTITWSALTGAGQYEAQYRISDSGEDWASVETTTATVVAFNPEGGPACGTTYEFRVRAYGDGTTYAAVWSVESGAEPATTDACNRDPEFGASAYSFSIAENAATSTVAGTVSATDPDTGDTVSYSITAGNGDGKFAIGESTGAVTVAGVLDPEAVAFYLLTVEAADGNGGVATATVGISLILADCMNGTVVPSPNDNPWLVRDCSLLLSAKDALAGEGSLDWSADTALSAWQGVGATPNPPRHVTTLLLADLGLTGSIPTALGGLEGLQRLDLDGNMLTGEIPSELSRLSKLENLYLYDNMLTGAIPPGLSRLSKLKNLHLNDNMLNGAIPPELGELKELRQLVMGNNMFTGGIPPQLGDMTSLEHLFLRDNLLTGAIPSELEGLSNLTILQLSGNVFTGCIPSGLRDVGSNDLDLLGLGYCTSSES